jgi:hypothetical protein
MTKKRYLITGYISKRAPAQHPTATCAMPGCGLVFDVTPKRKKYCDHRCCIDHAKLVGRKCVLE